jgi:galactose mutarotase-like enzyme
MSSNPVRLEAANLVVVAWPERGFTITEITDVSTGGNALWQRSGFEPADFGRQLGAPGAGSTDTFLQLFVGGWFEMFPTAGFSGQFPGPAGSSESFVHGEVMRLPWTIIEQSATVLEANVRTLHTPFDLTKRLELTASGTLSITEVLRNTASVPAPYVWGHHPCFDRATFAGGQIDAEAVAAIVPEPTLDKANDGLVPGAEFEWPQAPMQHGGTRSVDVIPEEADGRNEQVSLTLRSGVIRLTAPRIRRAFRFAFDVRDFPHLLVWQDFRAPGASYWGTCDTVALEPWSAPGRSPDEAGAAGAIRTLAPRASLTVRLEVAWEPL